MAGPIAIRTMSSVVSQVDASTLQRWDAQRYVMGELLGQGGAGQVYAAQEQTSGRAVAVKILPLDKQVLAESLREVHILKGLAHPALVPIEDVFCDDQRLYLVMARVPGETLKALLARGPVAPEQAHDWCLQAAEVLAAAHAQGVVHGDIKPSNLMVEPSKRLRLLDFGTARWVDNQATQTGVQVTEAAGTLAYMAPEQLMGRPATPASDMYALGLVLRDLLTGQDSADTQNKLSLAYQRLHGSEVGLPETVAGATQDLRTQLLALVKTLCAREPKDRPASMARVIEQLKALAADEPSHQPQSMGVAALLLVGVMTVGGMMLADRAGTQTQAARQQAASNPSAQPVSAQWVLAQINDAEKLLKDYDEPASLEQALGLLQDVLDRQPRHATAAALLSISKCMQYMQEGHDESVLKEAGLWADRALAMDSQLARAYVAKGWYESLAGEKEKAKEDLKKALVLDPNEWYGLYVYAHIFLAANRLDEAKEQIEVALNSYPDERLFYDTQGSIFYMQSNFLRAEESFRRSIKIKPTGSFAYVSLNAVLMKRNRNSEALATLQQGLRVRPDHRLYSNLGVALFMNGRFSESADAYIRALATLPKNQPDGSIQANLAEAFSRLPGREKEAKVAYEKALESVNKLLTRYPKNPLYLSRAGLFSARLGLAPQAQEHTSSALRLEPVSSEVLFNSATTAALLGDKAGAKDRLRRALAQGYPREQVEQEPVLADAYAGLKFANKRGPLH